MNLEKTRGASQTVKSLQPGDPWTFVSLTPEQMANALSIGVGGETSHWYTTGEPGRIFRIVAIHPDLKAVETVFVGFQEPALPLPLHPDHFEP